MVAEHYHRNDIDGLRAIAVAAVTIFHVDHNAIKGGFTGVDVFFVISGYVVNGSLSRARGGSLLSFLGCFWSRRVKRLSPALVAAAS